MLSIHLPRFLVLHKQFKYVKRFYETAGIQLSFFQDKFRDLFNEMHVQNFYHTSALRKYISQEKVIEAKLMDRYNKLED